MADRTLPGRGWYRIENKAPGDTASIFLYDELGSFGITANDFVKELRDVKGGSIDVYVNSPGGECYEGLAIFNALRNHKAHITVHIDGLAASAASFVAMAGDKIVAERNATLMIHEAHALGVGDANDMRKLGDMLDRMSDTIANIYAERAGGTVAQWRARMATETWFSADEAKAVGLVDEVVASPPIKGMPRNTWDLSIFNFAGRAAAPDPLAVVLADSAPIEPVEEEPTVGVVEDPAVEPEPVVEEPLVAAVFDPAQFRDAVQAAGQLPFDPTDFRDIMAALALDAPAPSPVQPRPVDLGPLPLPPDPGPPEPTPWDGVRDTIRAAVSLAANDAPAPDPIPQADPVTSPDPELSINLPAFRRSIKEARL